MTTIISGPFYGTLGIDGAAGGNGLTLPSSTADYTLTSTGTAVGGAGYSFQLIDISGFPENAGKEFRGGAGGIGVDMTAGGRLNNFGRIAGGDGGSGYSNRY